MRVHRKALVFAGTVAAAAATAAAAAPAHAGFVPALDSPFPTGATTRSMAVGDANRNGTIDVAAGGLRLLRNDGTGRLSTSEPIGALGPVTAVASGDLTGDLLPDFAAIVPGAPPRLVLYEARALGGYDERLLSDMTDATDVEVAHLNADSLADIVIAYAKAGTNVSVLKNLGGGPYGVEQLASGVPVPADVAVGDLTGDGLPDLVVAGGSEEVSTLKNVGDASFGPANDQPTAVIGTAERVAIGHFDGDPQPDVVATDSAGTSAVALMRGGGDGGLQAWGRHATGLQAPPRSIDAADVNGDGISDVAVGAAGTFAVLLGTGDAALRPAPDSPFGNGDPASGAVEDVVAVDMNHDGQRDVVTANEPGSVSVMLNTDTGLLLAQPIEVGFGKLPAGSTPRSGMVTLRSARGALRITRAEVQGPRGFQVDPTRCLGRTLLVGQSCSMDVVYTPARKAAKQTALLSVDANAAAVVVPLSATPRAPVLSHLRLTPRTISPGGRLRARYRLSEPARVRTLVQRALPGRRVAGRCVVPGRGNRGRRRCTIWTTVAKIVRQGVPGGNLLRLRARALGRSLLPGSYRLSLSAADRFRNRSEERFVRLEVAQAARRAK
jgi:hypothetical protein